MDRRTERLIDRRGVSFLAAAAMCAALVPVADGYAWVAATVGAVYVVLALASWLDALGRRRL
jgi:hypothetical protein